MKHKDMMAVSVDQFFTGLKIEMDIFIQLSQDKYVLVNRAGELFDTERLQRYQTKKITHLYVHKDDYSLFVNKQLSIAGIVVENEKFPPDRKTDVLSRIAETVYNSISELGLDTQSFETAKALSQHVIQFVERNSNLSKLFEALAKSSETTLKHSVAVGFLAPMIARNLK